MDRIDSALDLVRRGRRHRAVLGRSLFGFARHWLSGSSQLNYGPIKLHVEPTSVCNLRCPTCPQVLDAVAAHGYMSLELFERVVREARPSVKEINLFFRGESMIHPELPAMVRACARAGIVPHVNTNATLLNEDRARELLEAGVGKLTVSLDGWDRESYERMRKGARFERVIANVRRFLELKAERGTDEPYVVIQNITLREDTPDGPRIAAHFRELLEGLSIDEWDAVWAHDWSGVFPGIAPRYGSNHFPCNWIWKSMAVHWDGKVSSCCADFSGDQVVGDLAHSSLMDIWNGAPMADLREAQVEGRYREYPVCSGCDALWQGSGISWNLFSLAARALSRGRLPSNPRQAGGSA